MIIRAKRFAQLLKLSIFILIILTCFTANTLAFTVNLSASSVNIKASNVKILNNGKFALCYNSTSVCAINKSGVIWRKNLRVNCLDVYGKYIAIGELEKVVVLDLNGGVVWTKKVRGGVDSISVFNNLVAAGTNSGYVYCFNSTGGLLWEYNCGSYITNVCTHKNFVAVTDVNGNLYYFKKCENLPWRYTTGDKTLEWIYKTGWCIWKYNGIANAYIYPTIKMAVTNNTVILACKEMNEIFCFSQSGYLMWVKSVEGNPESISASLNGNSIAVGCSNGRVYVFNGNGNLLWKIKFNSPAFVSVSPDGNYVAIGSGEFTYLFSSSGKLIKAVYTDTTKSVSISDVTTSSINIAVVGGNEVYFVTSQIENTSSAVSNLNSSKSISVKASVRKNVSKANITAKTQPKRTQSNTVKSKSDSKVDNKKESILTILTKSRYFIFVLLAVIGIVGYFARNKLKKSRKSKNKKKINKSKNIKKKGSKKNVKESVKAKKKKKVEKNKTNKISKTNKTNKTLKSKLEKVRKTTK